MGKPKSPTDVSPWPPSSVSLFKKLDSTLFSEPPDKTSVPESDTLTRYELPPLFSSRFLPLPLVPQKPAVPSTDGSSQEMPKNLLKCKPRNFNTDVLLCLPQPVSSPKSSLTKHPLLKTSSNKR